ncbi:MAG: hypothetical protein HXX10_12975 [Rhodoplanes sp.]|uniref:hypothetical protein n=1 Tax=Rhodoplanes sp. TaxID=1968906 RepID=UPI00179B139D|nr:hypothetical protein [Rhodoplanes sp.]NVO14941.1 hypothetical protein [Rhodoplanes sp.]
MVFSSPVSSVEDVAWVTMMVTMIVSGIVSGIVENCRLDAIRSVSVLSRDLSMRVAIAYRAVRTMRRPRSRLSIHCMISCTRAADEARPGRSALQQRGVRASDEIRAR